MRRVLRRGCAHLFLVGLVALAALSVYWAVTWPDVAALAHVNPKSTAFIDRYLARERRSGGRHSVAWSWVPYARISPDLKRAVLVGEDLGFFSHRGFDLAEIRQALSEAWDERRLPRGASTITQQTAKNLWLSPSLNPLRKLREALLARQLERHLGKRRIFEIYLNTVEFGPGVYGAEAAARHFFQKAAADLSIEEAAQLAAGLPKPSKWHPGSASPTYQRRVRKLLHRMSRATFSGSRL